MINKTKANDYDDELSLFQIQVISESDHNNKYLFSNTYLSSFQNKTTPSVMKLKASSRANIIDV